MLGRPGTPLPVFTNSCAGEWLNRSVVHDRTIANSSTMPAVCGSTSETLAPLSPCWANRNRGPSTAESGWMNAYRCPAITDGGIGCPSSSASFGL